MKKPCTRKNVFERAALAISLLLGAGGWTRATFSLADLSHYNKEYEAATYTGCPVTSSSYGRNKTYEDYRLITDRTSKQYRFIQEKMTVDQETGLLFDADGFIGAALGYRLGEIGDRFYITLDTGIVIPVVKIDEKDARDAPDGCVATVSSDVIEFVIHTENAKRYFGSSNGYASNGNFNNSPYFKGNIVKFEKVTGVRKASSDPYQKPGYHLVWDGPYWYENGYRQGIAGDPKNLWDNIYHIERGREIYDPTSDRWYWLDANNNGAKALNKEVWIPYVYQKDIETGANPQGKWVRYDGQGKMWKGWYSISRGTYFYDWTTGAMAKGWTKIDGKWYFFNETTGILENK